MAERGPVLAFALTFAAALLVMVDGVLVGYAASLVDSAGNDSAGTLLSGVAALGVMFGFILLVLAFALYYSKKNRGPISVAILAFSVLSFFGGGGFYLGMLLGCAAAVLGLLFVPDTIGDGSYESAVDDELYAQRRERPRQRKCPTCGAFVYSDEMVCMRCGTGLSSEITHHVVGEPAQGPS